MSDVPAFRYRAVADDGRRTEIFTSNVEYIASDELPLRGARWTVERVEQEGFEHVGGVTVTVRTLHCEIGPRWTAQLASTPLRQGRPSRP